MSDDWAFFSLFLCFSALVLKQFITDKDIQHKYLIGTDLDSRIQFVEQSVRLQKKLAFLSTHPQSIVLEIGIQT